ncbi:MAG: hypothetical protein LCI00_15605 [Chloroflexi bacterium]|nr:hypothetical protein [Chloroflexota bacterium]
MKAVIVTDFAYKSPKRKGRGTGSQGLRATLKYLQYRDTRNNHLAHDRDYERWNDRGLGLHHDQIFKSCDQLQSKHVLAWTWVISPAPELMALFPESERRSVLSDLTERIVENYYAERGYDTPEYAFVVHSRMTTPEDQTEPLEHLHTHVVLPGTAPLLGIDRDAFYNNKERGHDALFREIGTRHFTEALDRLVGPEWKLLREEEPTTTEPNIEDLDAWFPNR